MDLLTIDVNSEKKRSKLPDKLVVNCVYGPVAQGEGATLGRPCFFLRLGGCCLACGFCDAAETWCFSDRLAQGHRGKTKYDPKVELSRMGDDEVIRELESLRIGYEKVKMLVVTGGEPLLQRDRLVKLLENPYFADWRIEVETAGVIAPSDQFTHLVDQFNISLKLENSGNLKSKRYHPEAIDHLMSTGKAVWKFVVVEKSDFVEIDDLVQTHRLDPIYLMPEGTSVEAMRAHSLDVLQGALARGWNMTTRLQIELNGDKPRT